MAAVTESLHGNTQKLQLQNEETVTRYDKVCCSVLQRVAACVAACVAVFVAVCCGAAESGGAEQGDRGALRYM